MLQNNYLQDTMPIPNDIAPEQALVQSAIYNGVPVVDVIRALDRLGKQIVVRSSDGSDMAPEHKELLSKLVQDNDPFSYFFYILVTFGYQFGVENKAESSENVQQSDAKTNGQGGDATAN